MSIRDGLRDADNFDRRPGAAIEPDVFAYGIDAWPIVFHELLVHDRDARRIRGIGRQEATAAQNRYSHRREESFVDGVERRREVLAIARHHETVRHESDAAEVAQSEGRVLREAGALNAGHCPRSVGQQLVELLCLRGVVLHQARIEPRHQQMIFREPGCLQHAIVETTHHQE